MRSMQVMNYNEAKEILEKQEAAKAVIAKFSKLASAHEAYGFKSRPEFIKALQELGGKAAPGTKKRKVVRRRKKKGGGGGRGLSADKIAQIQTMKKQGKSNAEISRTTKVSPITVAKYVKGK